MKNKEYNVIWEERHSVLVKAKNEEEAVEKAMEGNIIGDESAELSSSAEAFKLYYPNKKVKNKTK